MLLFGPAGVPPSCGSALEAVEYLAEIGLNALEIEFVHGVRMRVEEAARVRAAAEKRGISLSAHAPYYINLNSESEEVRKKSRSRVVTTMMLGSALGARVIVVHAGYYSGKSGDEATRKIAAELAECKELADKEGCGGVLIGLETMGRKTSWGTLEEIGAVASWVRGVVPVLDFAHIHARCGGCLRTAGDFERVLREFDGFGAPFLHSHFTGVEVGRRGERRHLELGSGGPDFSLLAPLLLPRSKRYDVTVICESPLLEQDALRMKETARSGPPPDQMR